ATPVVVVAAHGGNNSIRSWAMVTKTTATTTYSTPASIRSFSISPTVAGARTPRPKKRIVKEQKLQAVRSSNKARLAAASSGKSRSSNNNSSSSSSSSSNSSSSNNKGWTKLDSPRTTIASSSRSAGFQRRRPSNISVTSLQPGSRSPQYEHVFVAGSRPSPRASGGGSGGGGTSRPLMRTGNTGRDKAAAAEKQLQDAGAMRRGRGPSVRGFVPARFALQPIASDIKTASVKSRSHQQQQKQQAPRHATAVEDEPVFAETEGTGESAEALAKRVGEVRFDGMGLHPMVQRALLEVLAKTAPLSMRGGGGGPSLVQKKEDSGEVVEEDLTWIRPTEIQALAIPAMIDPRAKSSYTLCAAQTGSGKTLAYLTPVLHDLKKQEDAALSRSAVEKGLAGNADHLAGVDDEELQHRALSSVRPFHQPRAVILLPSRELVLQVSDILKQLSHTVKLRMLTIAHPMKPRDVLMRLNQGPVDVVVATPASLTDYLDKSSKDRVVKEQHPFVAKSAAGKERKMGGSVATLTNEGQTLMTLDNLQHLVIDEADTMFDRGFEEDVTKIVRMTQDATRHRGSGGRAAKITVVSATLPKKIAEHLDRLMPGMLKITTPSLHKSLPGLDQTFLDLKPYFGDRKRALLDILANQQRSKQHRGDNTLVFCNTKHSCDLLFETMVEKKVPGLVGVLHGDTKARVELLSEFTSSVNNADNKAKKSSGEAAVGKILISTDIASRGIDTTMVQHVILYDFPTTIVDYLHRVGRTARGGLGGRATSLIGRKDRNLAERVMLGIRYGKVLS
ncbi:putative ATP-dependent RNA helicase ddx28, partial [Actinomortierella ambigua]